MSAQGPAGCAELHMRLLILLLMEVKCRILLLPMFYKSLTMCGLQKCVSLVLIVFLTCVCSNGVCGELLGPAELSSKDGVGAG